MHTLISLFCENDDEDEVEGGDEESVVSDRSQVTGSSRSKETEEEDGQDLPVDYEELEEGLVNDDENVVPNDNYLEEVGVIFSCYFVDYRFLVDEINASHPQVTWDRNKWQIQME